MKQSYLFLIICLALSGPSLRAGTIVISSNTNWSTIGGGSGPFGLPDVSDSIIVTNNDTLTVDVDAVCGSILLGTPSSLGKASNGTLIFSAGKTLTVSGTMTIGNNGSRRGSVDMSAGGTLVCGLIEAGSIQDWTPGTGTLVLTGSQTLPNQISDYNNLTISGGIIVLSANTSIGGNLVISAGDTLDAHNGARSIFIGGNWTNDGAFLSGNGTVTFGGATAQSIGGSAPATFFKGIINNPLGVSLDCDVTFGGLLTVKSGELAIGAHTLTINNGLAVTTPGTIAGGSTSNLVIGGSTAGIMIPASLSSLNSLALNNPTGVAMGGNITVSGALALMNGLLSTAGNVFTLGVGATYSGSGATSYVKGTMARIYADSGTLSFPIGAGGFAPVTADAASGSFPATVTIYSVNTIAPGVVDTAGVLRRYYSISSGTVTAYNSLTFGYQASDIQGTEAAYSTSQWTGSLWEIVPCNVDISLHQFQTGPVTDIADSLWTAGETAALPIVLSTFEGYTTDQNVVSLSWSTVSESNTLGFTVERRNAAAGVFNAVSGLIQGAGTSLDEHHYTFTDQTVQAGTYYYRLKQTSADGGVAYSQQIMIKVSAVMSAADSKPLVFSLGQNYPNPFNPSTLIAYSLPEQVHVTLTIFNMLGQRVATLVDGVLPPGEHSARFEAASLPSGPYFYRIDAGSKSAIHRMMLLK